MNFFKNSRTYSFPVMLAIVGILISLVPAGAPTQKQSPAVSQADPGTPASATSTQTPPLAREQASAAYGKLPLSFEANEGQADKAVNFLARGAGYSLFLKPTEAVFAMSWEKDTAKRGVNKQPWQTGQPKSEMTKTETAILQMKIVGANADSPSDGLEEQQGKVGPLAPALLGEEHVEHVVAAEGRLLEGQQKPWCLPSGDDAFLSEESVSDGRQCRPRPLPVAHEP